MTATDDDNRAPAGGRDVVDQLRSAGALDGLFEQIDSGQVSMTGADGLLPALVKEALERGLAVKPRVLWRLVYLVPVVAGCDCSWRWVSGAQAASCSAGVRIPMAECGRVVLNQWTHSAVASTGGVDVLPRALVTDQLGLCRASWAPRLEHTRKESPFAPPR